MPNVWQFAISALFVVTVLIGANAVYASNSATVVHHVDDEAMTVEYGTWIGVNETYGRTYFDNETINASDGTTLAEGSDYLWSTTNGSVRYLNTTATTAGDTATVDYAFRAPTDAGRTTAAMMQVFGGILGILLFVAGVAAMFDISMTGGI